MAPQAACRLPRNADNEHSRRVRSRCVCRSPCPAMPQITAPLRLGTRASALARWQAEWVAARLSERGASVELVLITTQGDTRSQQPIGSIGGSGVFTKELQRALLDGRIDLAVHSLKDLPTDPVPGLILAAVPPRETTRDVLVCRGGQTWERLSQGAIVGTGSLRRKAQMLHVRPDLVVQDVRGNVQTRLARLDQGLFDAIVLAEAGLVRLGLAQRITEVLSPEALAVGQFNTEEVAEVEVTTEVVVEREVRALTVRVLEEAVAGSYIRR